MINYILLRLIYLMVRFLSYTYRFTYINKHYQEQAKQNHSKGGYIVAIWHQNAVAGITSQIGTPHSIIISQSKDGEFVSFTCKKLGHVPVRGSSHRGGNAAKNKMIDLINDQGIPGAITVDGPKGPFKSIKSGIFEIARKTESMIVPYSATPNKYWTFKSWDKFRLPWPFAKIIVSYGPPFTVKEPINPELLKELKKHLSNELDLCEDRALKYNE